LSRGPTLTGTFDEGFHLFGDGTTGTFFDSGSPTTPLLFDQWVTVRIDMDLDADTAVVSCGGVEIFNGVWNNGGTSPTQFQGINIWAAEGVSVAVFNIDNLRLEVPPVLTITRADASDFDLRWASQSNIYYSLWSSPDLSVELSNWDLAEGGIAATPPTNTIRVTAAEMVMENFYRVEEQPPPLVIPEMVEVGNPGNLDDTANNGSAPGDHSGAVPYVYSIGKYEVTNAEYVEFLNAVDPEGLNAFGLYNTSMSSSSQGGITLTAENAAGQKYGLKNGFDTKPVVYVSFYDTMRYCNWLHNGAQVGGDTENGAYTLLGGGATPTNGTTVERNSGAKFAMPTEDEWYKAAYHQPSGDGGPTDSYWLYPTPTGSLKGNDTNPPNASLPPGTPPAANYNQAVNTLTDVGAYTGTEGYYGTFDMAGNVFEWLETRSGSLRVLRGGSWFGDEGFLPSDFPDAGTPGLELDFIGFRISSP
jgi:formylglycine-generating enzyme required for sulfatase activity